MIYSYAANEAEAEGLLDDEDFDTGALGGVAREFLEEVTICLGYDIAVLDTRLKGIAQPKA